MEKHDGQKLKENPFTAPEGYFQQLDQRIHHRITSPSKPLAWQGKALRLAAASFVILLTGWYFLPATKAASAEEILAEISEEELASYIEFHDTFASEDVLSPAEEEADLQDFYETDTL